MKKGILVSIIFSIIYPVIFYGITAVNQNNMVRYESYCDESGNIRDKEISAGEEKYPDNIYTQYWQIHGIEDGLIYWIKASLISLFLTLPPILISIRLVNKSG